MVDCVGFEPTTDACHFLYGLVFPLAFGFIYLKLPSKAEYVQLRISLTPMPSPTPPSTPAPWYFDDHHCRRIQRDPCFSPLGVATME